MRVGLVIALVAAGALGWQAYRVRGFWRLADDALRRHDLAAAAAYIDDYLAHRPNDAAAWFLAARTARRLDRYPEAERYLNQSQQVGGVTEATRLEWDLLRVHQGNLGDIHTRLRRTIRPDDPNAPFVLEALARGYLLCDRLRDAVEACELWLAIQPELPWPWLWRAGVYERLGNFHEALSDYQRAVELAPEDREARLALAALLVRGRRPASAIDQFEKVLSKAPANEEARLGLAGARIDQGRPADALPLLEPLLAKDPPPARALFLRGKAALELRDAGAAVDWLIRATRQAPDDAEALYQLTLALRAAGRRDESERLTPRLEVLRRDLDRLNVLIRTIGRDHDVAESRHEAGMIALRLGRTDDGLRWLESALRAKGDHRPTHAALAEYYHQKGDPRAEAHRRMAHTP